MKQFLVMVTCSISLIASATENSNTKNVNQLVVKAESYRCSIRDKTCFESRKPVVRALRRLR